ncbi:PhzF family phenazine biosynthesis protein [Luminiphilus sp. nBUS_07]|uniref:PhzF family phenazine biosynthesis protein n=1 Tax=Luminiphilus sp. nBUS_07 TaxID=3395314 RepID=UPI003EBEFFD2
MSLPLYIVNAFTKTSFGGNPAAVVPLPEWLPDKVLLGMAAQHNLSETAFVVPREEGLFELRWFTPGAEVELCGHATLASAHVLSEHLGFQGDEVTFSTRFSGELRAHYYDGAIELDFPSLNPQPYQPEPALIAALGVPIIAAAIPQVHPWKALYEVESEAVLRQVVPDFPAIAAAVDHAVILTARGERHDFVSRFFAPNLRVNEDPVTGSAHCVLAPYWAAKLGVTQLSAAQISTRGGVLKCVLAGDRVKLTGDCVTYAVGEIVESLEAG